MSAKVEETIVLKKPVTVTLKPAGGEEREETIAQLEVWTFKAKDLRYTDGLTGEASKGLAMMARMTRQPVKVIDELEAEDVIALTEVLNRFLPSGQKIGETQSES